MPGKRVPVINEASDSTKSRDYNQEIIISWPITCSWLGFACKLLCFGGGAADVVGRDHEGIFVSGEGKFDKLTAYQDFLFVCANLCYCSAARNKTLVGGIPPFTPANRSFS